MDDEKISFSGHEWIWALITGFIFLGLGVVAFSMPLISTVGVTYGLAGILVIGGVSHLAHSIKLRHHRGGATRFFESLISIITGALMFAFPGAGILGLALALSFYFFLNSAAKWILYMAMRPHPGWGWGIASSIASFALGVLIVTTFPFSALWIPGTLLGIDLLVAGATMVGLSFSIRKVCKGTSSDGDQKFVGPNGRGFRPAEQV